MRVLRISKERAKETYPMGCDRCEAAIANADEWLWTVEAEDSDGDVYSTREQAEFMLEKIRKRSLPHSRR